MTIAMARESEANFEQRNEERYRRQVWIKVRALDRWGEYNISAFTCDISPNGLAIYTNVPLPLGTLVLINKDGDYAGSGEIISQQWDEWGRCGLLKLGIRLTDQRGEWTL